jgi:hypothetical protein
MASPLSTRMFNVGYEDELLGRECLVDALLAGDKRASAVLYKAGRVRATRDRMVVEDAGGSVLGLYYGGGPLADPSEDVSERERFSDDQRDEESDKPL